eukprot:15432204-Alexandrium_andersonii.AAC.1
MDAHMWLFMLHVALDASCAHDRSPAQKRACVRTRARVRACVRACMRVCVCVFAFSRVRVRARVPGQ